jgi:hypothetical protein
MRNIRRSKQIAISNWQLAKAFYRRGREERKGIRKTLSFQSRLRIFATVAVKLFGYLPFANCCPLPFFAALRTVP